MKNANFSCFFCLTLQSLKYHFETNVETARIFSELIPNIQLGSIPSHKVDLKSRNPVFRKYWENSYSCRLQTLKPLKSILRELFNRNVLSMHILLDLYNNCS